MSDDLVREKLRLYADDVAPVHLPSFGGVIARRRRRRAQQLLSATSAVVVVALVVVLAVVLGGGSLGAPASGLSSELIGGKWTLGSITTAGAVWKAPADNGFSLSFTVSGYTGNDSCNGTSGTVSYGKDTVHLGSGAMTDIGCIGDDQARMQEAFRLLIDKDVPATVSAGTLTITAGQTVFALTRVQPATPVDLSKALPGTTWALVSVGAIGKEVSSSTAVPDSVYADIAFRTKDFSANDGCNSHDGTTSYSPTAVTFTDEATSAALCEGPAGANGSAYNTVLQGTVTPTIVGDTLTLATPTASLTFTRETPAYVERRLTANSWTLGGVGSGGAVVATVAKWTLTMTATSYRAAGKCTAYNGAVSYDSTLLMQAGTVEGTCVEPASSAGVVKAYRVIFAGKVDVTFGGQGMTLSGNGSVLTYQMGSPSPAAATAAPVASAVASGAIAGLKSTLTASPWKLLSLTTSTVSWQAIATSTAGLTFSDKGYQASDGCDSQGTDVVYDESAATVDFIRGGEMSEGSCSFAAPGPPKGTLAPQAYFDALLGPLHVALSGDTLTLTRTGVVLTFTKQVSDTASSNPAGKALEKDLAASPLRLISVDAPGTYWRAIAGSTASLTFAASTFAASDGCSGLQSAVTYGQPRVVGLGGKEAQVSACAMAAPGPPQGTIAPPLFFASLAGEVKVALDGNVVTLMRGTTVLTLTRGDVAHVDPQAGDRLQTLLTGHTWSLHLIRSAGKTWGDPQQVVLRFGAHGYSINPDCNEHDGAVSYAEGNLVMRFTLQSAAGCAASETTQARSAAVVDALFSGPVSVEEDAGLLILWNGSESLELHQGPAPKHDLGLDLPPASATAPAQ